MRVFIAVSVDLRPDDTTSSLVDGEQHRPSQAPRLPSFRWESRIFFWARGSVELGTEVG